MNERQVSPGGEPTLGDLRGALIEIYGTDYGLRGASYISRFTDMARQAARYRERRVLLAGDAAHVHSPVSGQGLNIGVQDAVNLGWKLAQVVDGTSPESLLDTYHTETTLSVRACCVIPWHSPPSTARTIVLDALREIMCELMQKDGPRKQYVTMVSGLDVHYDFG